MLGIGPCDSTDSAQFADTISRVESSDTMNASVPIGCIRCIKLVAASDPVDTGKTYDCILNGKSESPATPKTLVIPRSLSLDRTFSITVVGLVCLVGDGSCNISWLELLVLLRRIHST